MDIPELVGGGTGLLVLGTIIGQWIRGRFLERRTMLQVAIDRISQLEGRLQEQSLTISNLQNKLGEERVAYTREIEQLRAQVSRLSEELDKALEENARLRGYNRHQRSDSQLDIEFDKENET